MLPPSQLEYFRSTVFAGANILDRGDGYFAEISASTRFVSPTRRDDPPTMATLPSTFDTLSGSVPVRAPIDESMRPGIVWFWPYENDPSWTEKKEKKQSVSHPGFPNRHIQAEKKKQDTTHRKNRARVEETLDDGKPLGPEHFVPPVRRLE